MLTTYFQKQPNNKKVNVISQLLTVKHWKLKIASIYKKNNLNEIKIKMPNNLF